MNTLIILRGLSGSGKSTYCVKNYPKAFICSADDYLIEKDGQYVWRADKLMKAHYYSMNACKAAMINKLSTIIVDNTNTKTFEMKPYIDFGKQYNYEIKIIRLLVSPETASKRNVHNVPDEIVKTQHARMAEIPEAWGIKEEIIIND